VFGDWEIKEGSKEIRFELISEEQESDLRRLRANDKMPRKVNVPRAKYGGACL
jgi:hypothetical protein